MSDIHIRAFPAQIEQKGERQITGRLVPYDIPTIVADKLPDGRFETYREGFRRGAFDGQMTVGQTNKGVLTKIGLIHRHEGGLGYLGPVVALREQPDGLWGDITIMPSKTADVAALLNAGVEELSIEFRLRGQNHTDDRNGVRWRTCAHLDAVALEPQGAYRNARVLQYRADAEEQRLKLEADEAEAKRLEADNEAQRAATALEEQRLAEEHRKANEEAEAALQRRQKFDELAARLEGEQAKQRAYAAKFK